MNIMLFSDIPPCTNYTAGIVLNILCDFLLEEGHNVSCFTVKHSAVEAAIPQDKLNRMKFVNVMKPKENWGTSFLRGAASFIGNNAIAMFKLPEIASQAASFAKENKTDLIWGVVQGQTMIKLLEPTAKKAGIPYVVQVWDPPEWWLTENKFDQFTFQSVMKSFGKLLTNSQCCIAASWAMAEAYQREYKCKKCIPVILGFSPERPIPKKQKCNDDFVIALSGQIYAIGEFNTLLASLNKMNWTYAGKKIVLRLYGREFHFYFSQASNIEVRGWLEQSELLSELCDADLLYCPYWFDLKFEKPCKLSFPSKLSTYLKAGVPVLFHGPEYASPRIFLKKHNAAYICGSMDVCEIADMIQKIMDDSEREKIGETGYSAFLNNLTLNVMKDSFLKALQN